MLLTTRSLPRGGTASALPLASASPKAARVASTAAFTSGFRPPVALATACPGAVVDAVDVNPRALRLCADNARAQRVGDRVRPLLPEDADPQARYDELWSNPPIRIGKQALHELLLTWLPRLKPDGVARLVVGRNLGADSLQRWLIDQGWACERTASAKGFRVFAVSAAAG